MWNLYRRNDQRRTPLGVGTMTSSSSRYDPRRSKPGRVTGQTVHDRDATVVRMYGRFMPTAKRPSAPQRGDQCSAPSAKEPRHKVMRCQTESSSCTARHEEKLHRHGPWRGVLGKNIRSFLKSLGKYYVCPVPAYECPKPNAKPLLPPPSTKRSKSTCGGAGTMKINLCELLSHLLPSLSPRLETLLWTSANRLL